MLTAKCDGRRGFSFVEVLTVIAVIGVLVATGFLLQRSMRQAARVATAEARLKQVSAGLELYFRDHQGYPPEGSDLTVALRPYISNPAVFHNPLHDEVEPGDDLNDFYLEPALRDIDRPGIYVVCFPPGSTREPVVVLETGDRITRRGSPGSDVDTLQRDELVSFLYQATDVTEGDGGGGTTGDDDDDDGTTDDPTPPDDPTDEPDPDDYTEESPEGTVTVNDCYDATFEVICSSLTWGFPGPEVPTTVGLVVYDKNFQNKGHGNNVDHDDADNTSEGIGDHGAIDGYDVEDSDSDEEGGPAPYMLFGTLDVDGGEVATVTLTKGQSFNLTFEASYDLWGVTYSSDGDPTQVLTLRNGDTPVEFDPTSGNAIAIGDAFAPYIDAPTGTISIADNQVLYLVELGSTSRVSVNFDYQDLLILVSLSPPLNPDECNDSAWGQEKKDTVTVEENNDIVTVECSSINVTSYGSEFRRPDGTPVPITASVKIGEADFAPLFDGQPLSTGGGETEDFHAVVAGTPVHFKAEMVGEYEVWLWSQYGFPTSYTSNDGTGQVILLRHGDVVTHYDTTAVNLMRGFLDPQTGVLSLPEPEKQVLAVWDFNPIDSEQGLDYDDLVLLISVTALDSAECDATDAPTAP